jgi:EAL domain-containing protein (putative c-di-GMP-specific phosphodiesterase class I)
MLGDLEIRITCSIGAAILDRNDLTTPELLRRAEESMYLVKHGVRNGYCIATPDIIRDFKNRLDLDRNIHEAVYQKRLLLHFQPIVEIETGRICSAEALLRVINKDGSVLAAFNIIPSMQRIRLMAEVDEWVFAESVRLLQQHMRIFETIPGFRLSLNVSPSILMTHGFATLSLNRLKTAGVSPTMFRFEIIENHLDMGNASLFENITFFREAGVEIAIDDFGTGYSNLQHLISIPCDTLKIDRMFIKVIPSGEAKKIQLLTAMIKLGKNLGYSLIAEGIEHQEQADQLLSLGCEYGQGYLYGRPMEIERFLEHIVMHTPNILPLSKQHSSIQEFEVTPTYALPSKT